MQITIHVTTKLLSQWSSKGCRHAINRQTYKHQRLSHYFPGEENNTSTMEAHIITHPNITPLHHNPIPLEIWNHCQRFDSIQKWVREYSSLDYVTLWDQILTCPTWSCIPPFAMALRVKRTVSKALSPIGEVGYRANTPSRKFKITTKWNYNGHVHTQ